MLILTSEIFLEHKLAKLTLIDCNTSFIVKTSRSTLSHYPKINLSTFDGNLRNWLDFWGQFKNIDSDQN